MHCISRRLIVLSPHPDDAAFSVGGLIQRVAASTTLMTIFGRSDYTSNFREQSHEVVTSLRRNEDARYARLHMLRWMWNDYPSAGLRFKSDFTKVFFESEERSWEDRKRDIDEWSIPIQQAFMSCFPEDVAPFVLLPIGIGGHRDHVVVRDSIRQLHSARRFSLGFYEDLPYAVRKNEGEIHDHVGSLKLLLSELHVPTGRYSAKRQQGISIYASQVDTMTLQALDMAHTRFHPEAERLWVTNKPEWENFLAVDSEQE